ncbi:unnamed protein product [Blepharisma stoltei]|uniref:Receptor ligand binding region domain-containing protein n=1 Tax=Blepharisma stoltei TaxID=1481888 RepID=A0AAU9IZJ1_9CILI|nr:unnamed protein product [Blepharisma stoltei]
MWTLSPFAKFLFFANFINLSISTEIIIIKDDVDIKNSLWNETVVINFLQNSSSQIDWHICPYISAYECIESYPNAFILLDLSQELNTQVTVSQLCKEYKKAHLIVQDDFRYFDDWTYSVISSKINRLTAFFAMLKYYSWNKGIIFTSELNQDIFLNFTTDFEIFKIQSKTDMQNLIMRVIPALGSTLYYIFTEITESLLIQKYLIDANLWTSGNGVILNQKSGYQYPAEGALIITDMGQEYADSEEKYLSFSILSIISDITKNTENSIEAISLLQKTWNSHYHENKFSIVNIQGSSRVIIGSIIDAEVLLYENSIFPGKTSEIPKSAKKILNLSIEGGTTNPNYSSSSISYLAARGSFLAVDYINTGISGMLPNFQLDMFTYDCGVSIYNETFAKPCFIKNYANLGLAHIPSYASPVGLGVLKLFTSLNWTLPIVGTCSDPAFNSTALYPWFQRVWPSSSFTYPLFSVLLRSLGFKQAAVLYQNDSWGQGGYYYLRLGISNHDIKLVNSEESRAIPSALDRNTIKNYLYIMQGVIDSQARLVIFIIQFPLVEYVLEAFYDLGLRRGDVIIFTAVPDILTSILTSDDYLYKRLELGVPMLTFLGEQWVGTFGQGILSKMLQTYNNSAPSSFSCHYFDIIYLIGHALDNMINRGQDYTNPYKLEKFIRNTRFIGCSGRVVLEKESNDRFMSVIDAQASKFDINGNVVRYLVAEVKPVSTQILYIYNPVVYPDGTTNKPDDLRNQNYDCPFSDNEVKTFIKGQILVFCICFVIAFISIIIIYFIWKRWWNIPIEELRERQEISYEDFLVGATIAIEFFQFVSMGPNISYLSSILGKFSNSLTLELANIIKLKNGVFWVIVDAVYGLIMLWTFMCVVIIFRLDEKSKFWVFRLVNWFGDFLMPILGNLCFMPFISICLDIFVCDQSIGNSFTDSFLSYDCYYFCWKDEHLAYAILSIFALLCYEPLAVFCRPLWQELQPMLHVKAAPSFLMIKTIVQVSLIVMNKTVKRAQNIIHGVLFIFIMIFYITFLFKFKPYNYSRFSLWQNLSLIGVTWQAILSTIALGVKGNSIILTVLLFSGWFIIIVFGLYIQRKKYPSLLYRKKPHDTTSLFKFAFTFGKTSHKALTKIAPSSSSSERQKINIYDRD